MSVHPQVLIDQKIDMIKYRIEVKEKEIKELKKELEKLKKLNKN